MDERSPGIPADCLRDHLTGLIIPYSLETWLRVPETPPRHLSEYATLPGLSAGQAFTKSRDSVFRRNSFPSQERIHQENYFS